MAITLRVCGAAQVVTGSCLVFETPMARFAVDCGMFQGPKSLKALNYEPLAFDPTALDAVLLTHAHIDHSGLLPRLPGLGFRGPIHATPATVDLCSCMLPDAGHIQEHEVEILNRRNRNRGRDPVQPIYTAEDAERTLALFAPVEYGAWFAPVPGVRARYWNAGHMLGSASAELVFDLPEGTMRVVVSGDIGPDDGTMQHRPEAPMDGVDHLIVESTYGDEDRPTITPKARRAALGTLVRAAHGQGGALLIPTFAVERAQEVLLDLVHMMNAHEVPIAPIYLDSPLATRASRVFQQHARTLEDGRALRAALTSPRLRYVADGEESQRITRQEGFHILLAGSGMCEAGRIRAHLKARLWDRRAIVALVGFQAAGTLGRLLQDGASEVRIQGDTYRVGARIARIEGYSAHADGPELGRWVAARGALRGGVFLVHGEPEAIEGLAARLTGPGRIAEAAVIRPLMDEAFALAPGKLPQRLPAAGPRRRAEPESLGRPDWHNKRAALLLDLEKALDEAGGESARLALLEKLRRVVGDHPARPAE